MSITSAPRAAARVVGSTTSHAEPKWAHLLVISVWAWVFVPRLVQSLTAAKARPVVGVPPAPPSALTALVQMALLYGLAALCVVIIVEYAKDKRPRPIGPLIVMLAPWVYMVIRDVYVADNPTVGTLLYPLVITALWMLRPSIHLLRTLGILIAVSAVVSIALAVALPDKGIFRTSLGAAVTEEKEILPWGILVGFLTHGNAIGQWMALGLPFVALIRRTWLRLLMIATIALCVLWSASRSSMLAVVIAGLVALALSVSRPQGRRVLGPLLMLPPLLIVCALPLVTTNPTSFTNRGLIWGASLDAWQTSPWVGLGSSWYQRVGNSSERLAGTVFHGHNQLVQFLVTGGLILVALMLIQIVWVAARATQLAARGHIVPVAYLAALAAACTLEKAFTIVVDTAASFPTVVLPLAIIMFQSTPDGPSRPPRQRSAAARVRALNLS